MFLLGGGGVLAAKLWPGTSRLGRRITQIVLGVSFLAFLFGSALPNRIWTGMLFYGGIGTLPIVGPRISRYARRVDSSSLRMRLALAMASAAAIPLIFVAAVATGWEEQAAVDQQLNLQQALAGGPVLIPVMTPRQIASLADSEEHRRALAWLGVRSLVVVPLRVREQTLGALTCVYGRGSRRYSTEDLPLAQELALRAALAIDNARLYAAERTARAEAEAAVRVREEFLAIAAHELKTPVTSLRGFAELGVRALGVNGTLDATLARRTLETIDRQSARLAALVVNLLEAARVRAQQHSITLSSPDSVEAVVDPLRIEQVLTNLVDNAVKYSPAGSLIEVSVAASSDRAELIVRDHGVGIPVEHQERIFDRFFQAHVGEQSSGMGLGLYISHEIVRHHGGTIRVEAPEDGGTRMVVSLPRGLPHDSASEAGRLSA